MSIKTKMSGPLFAGDAPKVLDDYSTAAEKAIGDYALAVVGDELRTNIRHSTGRYISHVQVRVLSNEVLVTDGGVVYGPWLEGTSSRNDSTRFKGYASFRRSVKRIQDKAVDLAESVLPEYLDRLS